MRHARTYPLDQVLLLTRSGIVDDSPAGDHLEKHDPEAVDVGFGSELAGAGVLGGAVAVGSHDPGGNMGAFADGADLGKPEIGEFGIEMGV